MSVALHLSSAQIVFAYWAHFQHSLAVVLVVLVLVAMHLPMGQTHSTMDRWHRPEQWCLLPSFQHWVQELQQAAVVPVPRLQLRVDQQQSSARTRHKGYREASRHLR